MCIISIDKLVENFNKEKAKGESNEYLNELANKIQEQNMLSYAQDTAFVFRRTKITDFEMDKWMRLSQFIKPCKNIKLFETAFGSGRDLLIAQELGYDVYGCELSKFLYSNFLLYDENFKNKIVLSDLRLIPFKNDMFNIVRHNASFLHMPIIDKGFTVHRCFEESYRILKNNGILYIFTKEGQGFHALDTGDGLGFRSFQLYNENLLEKILLDCGFSIVCANHYIRERNGTMINWIEVFAQKV